MADFTVTKLNEEQPVVQRASFKIVEPKTIQDLEGNDVVVAGLTYNITKAELAKQIVLSRVKLEKLLALDARIDEIV